MWGPGFSQGPVYLPSRRPPLLLCREGCRVVGQVAARLHTVANRTLNLGPAGAELALYNHVAHLADRLRRRLHTQTIRMQYVLCLLYTSDAADERSSVDLGGRRII